MPVEIVFPNATNICTLFDQITRSDLAFRTNGVFVHLYWLDIELWDIHLVTLTFHVESWLIYSFFDQISLAAIQLEPILKLEILRLDEARAFRKSQFTRSKWAFEKGDNEV